MQIELYIDDEKKTFTTHVVPMLARRKYLEIEAAAEEKIEKNRFAALKYSLIKNITFRWV